VRCPSCEGKLIGVVHGRCVAARPQNPPFVAPCAWSWRAAARAQSLPP
jgi:hypothetical protein